MCGIAGIFNYADPERPVDRALLERMTRSLAHRGPDGEGFHLGGPIGLGHRRLAIVDLSPTGAQPMLDESKRWCLSYNGEFYNHVRFRSELEARHRFRGTSDTETLLYLLADRGPDALAKTSAIFGLALWDSKERALLLARDHLGVKQVYFYDDGRRVLFASEIKALLQCPEVPRELDGDGLNEYLHFHTPLFERTFFKGIRQLRPGECVRFNAGGAKFQTYWRVERFTPHEGTPEIAVGELRAHLSGVVGDQLMADVPVGAFFSGGIDSTAVASFAKKAGKAPHLFGVHFSHQGVIDERPFQEAAAKALGLELELTTVDGSSFPEDLWQLLYFQDQPVIGPALIPMYAVSRLAAKRVKVCLGGQAGDEIFGGYARYALGNPARVLARWIAGKARRLAPHPAQAHTVGGNLWRQLADPRILRRLQRNLRHVGDWRSLYFENFAQQPEELWSALLGPEDIVSREACWEVFRHTVDASPAQDASTRLMHWDLQAYLPGLFQQDDRMSMANSLESRVPLADPRLVEFAFQTGTNLKLRDGATKWILRQAVADDIPEMVLNRRKVGFDTPVESWMTELHRDFVHDTLLSRRARERGLWNSRGILHLLEAPRSGDVMGALWKVLALETWATIFLDGAELPPTPRVPALAAELRDDVPAAEPGHATLSAAVQELKELGPEGTLFRVGWEVRQRLGLMPLLERRPDAAPAAPITLLRRFRQPEHVARTVRDRIPVENLAALEEAARESIQGRLICFSKWKADFGNPIDWYLNPTNGRHWSRSLHWSKALAEEHRVGDVKFTWEIGRFPQAYLLARSAAFDPRFKGEAARAFAGQVRSFIAANPPRLGIHWNSGQEIVIRALAWVFAASTLADQPEIDELLKEMSEHLWHSLRHVEEHRRYAEMAVHNNHLIFEALGNLLSAALWPSHPDAERQKQDALEWLTREADAQFYSDGGYIQQSNTYERAAMQAYTWATLLAEELRIPVPRPWTDALSRATDFLVAQQNPDDGRLPNYGANDGTLPCVLHTCDYADFRPILQLASWVARHERLFPPGPWDESLAWMAGPEALEAPVRSPRRVSASFATSGHHVLRGDCPDAFTTFRCGTLLDRFSQIDMLQVDVFWHGLNVLVDGGSYRYNGAERWHAHFFRTASHNTLTVDGLDQMVHYRRFKTLYWTEAELLRFRNERDWALVEGQHFGYRRHSGGAVHRRTVLMAKDGLWVVVDRVDGDGEHLLRQHWLAGDFPYEFDEAQARLTLNTPAGPFCLTTVTAGGRPLAGDVVRGQNDPPRGWQSRYYGFKQPVPSLAIERFERLPATWITVLSAGVPLLEVDGDRWRVCSDTDLRFTLRRGLVNDVAVKKVPPRP